MAFSLDKVVPWGRSYAEYLAMFSLSKDDISKNILGCSDGPASFNSQLTKNGGKIVSVDPLYEFKKHEVEKRIKETFSIVMEQTEQNKKEFNWDVISTIEELGKVRSLAMQEFLADYEAGLKEGRYINGNLPTLPFKDKSFDIALCSHFLFLYSEQNTLEFHIKSIKELCRVSKEVRIFPLLELGSKKSRHLNASLEYFEEKGFETSVNVVNYEFQKGGNEMLIIKST